ncbi:MULTISPECIES: staphylopine family metallophore export MFS transporter CntE [Lysinibacillus]|jgi:MFS family permease|uniref:MFS transporter n=1 Tax=Lysinibacillus fusiformis TaxID=28031 RepID=A0A2I0UYY3_9BACI|nr:MULTISPECIES: MFS transporter [Lysinibacillus]PKU51273.1 MFS transporter [Lysinibacillus fusiformis]
MKVSPLSFSMLQNYGLAIFYFTANSVLTVIFPLQAANHGMKEAEIGLMMGIYMFVCMVLRPWAGQMVSKYSVHTVMKYLLLGHVAALLLYVSLGVESLYVVRILQGIVTAFFSMSMQMGITETLRDEDRGQGMAMYSLSSVMPGLYGPALAMVIWVQGDVSWLLIFITCLAFAPLMFFIRSPLPKVKKENVSFTLEDMRKGMKLARAHKGLIVSSGVMLIGASIFGAISTFLPLYFLTTNTGNVGLYLFLQALVVVGSRFIFRKYIPSDGKWHPGFITLILSSSIIGTTMLAALPLIGSFVYISVLFNGIAAAMLYPTLTTYISFAIPESHKHVLLGLFLASYDLGFSLGGMVMGIIVQFGSYPMMFSACSVIGLLAIIYNLTASGEYTNLEHCDALQRSK